MSRVSDLIVLYKRDAMNRVSTIVISTSSMSEKNTPNS